MAEKTNRCLRSLGERDYAPADPSGAGFGILPKISQAVSDRAEFGARFLGRFFALLLRIGVLQSRTQYARGGAEGDGAL